MSTPTRQRTGATGAVVRTALAVTGTAVAGSVAAAVLGRLLRHVGSTAAEREARLPGDELLPDADVVATRAIAVAAPVEAVWPWLVQLGWGRGGWYSLDAVEALVGAARSVDADGRSSWRSLRAIVPGHQRLAVGDLVPLRGDVGLTVAALEEPDHLVLELDRLGAGTRLRWVWCLALRPDGPDRCRLLVRTRTSLTPAGIGRPLQHLLLDPGHAIMELVQLRGIRDRAEGTT